MSAAYFAKLQDAILKMHELETEHLKTVPVTEMFRDQIAWEGEVEVFQVKNHPKIKRCYAWGYDEDGKLEIVTVLGLPPIESAEMAVRAVIASKFTK